MLTRSQPQRVSLTFRKFIAAMWGHGDAVSSMDAFRENLWRVLDRTMPSAVRSSVVFSGAVDRTRSGRDQIQPADFTGS